jgi:hypothetical protein
VAVGGTVGERFRKDLEIIGREDAVGIEENEIVAFGTFHPIVTGEASSGIGLGKVTDTEAVGEALRHFFTRYSRTILHKDGLEIGISLLGKAFEEFTHLSGTVVDGDDDGILWRHVVAFKGKGITWK